MSSKNNLGRGIRTLMASTPAVHASESLNEKYYTCLKLRSGKNYMKTFKRPAYYGTTLQQKDIHGILEEE